MTQPAPNVWRETLALLSDVITDFVQNERLFFGLEATNEVKLRGKEMQPPAGFGRHREMAPAVRQMYDQGLMPGYETVLVPVQGGKEQAFLYQPIGTSPEETQQYVEEHGEVQALPPLEVLLQSSPALSPTPANPPTSTPALPVAAPPTSTPPTNPRLQLLAGDLLTPKPPVQP